MKIGTTPQEWKTSRIKIYRIIINRSATVKRLNKMNLICLISLLFSTLISFDITNAEPCKGSYIDYYFDPETHDKFRENYQSCVEISSSCNYEDLEYLKDVVVESEYYHNLRQNDTWEECDRKLLASIMDKQLMAYPTCDNAGVKNSISTIVSFLGVNVEACLFGVEESKIDFLADHCRYIYEQLKYILPNIDRLEPSATEDVFFHFSSNKKDDETCKNEYGTHEDYMQFLFCRIGLEILGTDEDSVVEMENAVYLLYTVIDDLVGSCTNDLYESVGQSNGRYKEECQFAMDGIKAYNELYGFSNNGESCDDKLMKLIEVLSKNTNPDETNEEGIDSGVEGDYSPEIDVNGIPDYKDADYTNEEGIDSGVEEDYYSDFPFAVDEGTDQINEDPDVCIEERTYDKSEYVFE